MPHFFRSPEGPYYEQASSHLYSFTYFLIQLSWTLSFVITMAAASRLRLHRLPIFFTYMGKMLLTVPEVIWYQGIFQMIERLNWSHDFGVGRDVRLPTYYEVLKLYPSLFWGPRRAMALSIFAVVFMVVGFEAAGARWARWGGSMAIIELVLRTSAHVLWTRGPQTRAGRKFQVLIRDHWWPRLRATLLEARQRDINMEQERVPYSEAPPKDPAPEWRTFPGLRFMVWLGFHVGIQQSTVVNFDLTRGLLFRRTWHPDNIARNDANVDGNLGELHCGALLSEIVLGTLWTIGILLGITLAVIAVTSWGCCRLLVQFLMDRSRLLFSRS